MAFAYEKAKRSQDFDGDHAASVIAHMLNLGATEIIIRTSKAGVIEFESNAKLPDDQVPHLELVDKGEVVKEAAESVKP